jgi:periplasmic protein TonB
MEPNKILKSHLLDLVFDNRNKAYGAYELRVTYPERIKRSLLITLGIGVMIFTGVAWTTAGKTKVTEVPDEIIYNARSVPNEPTPPTPPPPPPPAKQTPPLAEVRTEKFIVPVIDDDDKVKDQPIAVKDLDDAKIGVVKTPGVEDPGDINDPNEGVGKIIVQQKNSEPEDFIHTTVQVEAKFDGDWSRFLKSNLRADTPAENGAPIGVYTVIVQFVVDVDGSLSNIVAISDKGFGLEKEAIRVLKQSKKWKPAIQNGRPVKAYRTQPITFVLDEG